MATSKLTVLATNAKVPLWRSISKRGKTVVEPRKVRRTILAQCCKPGCTPCKPKRK
ncbi:MAG: hypothetical protein UW85_C0001G0028 [Parcubacteria group bacterium GW2011_GWA1_Parcubacteria_45_10]|nr:MAG: hypothetical protein UW85_C0001G0028 [Parcubacteria group bacterium GW2011_GWA1_Parcubacteria_45_10]KKT89309.1 MAG: hypothetical protein UW89_C0001G0037 [Parcubacteria group bacterium GW2011_GWB1_45_10]